MKRINNSSEEAYFWLEQAIAYYESSKILENSSSEYKGMPIITLQAFSAECSLKYLLLCSVGRYGIKHDLDKLFDALPKESKDNICNEFSVVFDDLDFNQCISEVSKYFVESRYYFDELKKLYCCRGFYNGFLNSVAGFLIEYCNNKKASVARMEYGTTIRQNNNLSP